MKKKIHEPTTLLIAAFGGTYIYKILWNITLYEIFTTLERE